MNYIHVIFTAIFVHFFVKNDLHSLIDKRLQMVCFFGFILVQFSFKDYKSFLDQVYELLEKSNRQKKKWQHISNSIP